ncbi:MAG: DNA-binding protein, partial [Bacteroidales bacterium]|nr:DNA-binding protein [Bacteroidales bacterium]
MKTVKTFIERGNDGSYSVYVNLEDKTLNYGIHGTGKTAKEAVNDFISAYETMKEFHNIKGKEFVEANFNFVYDVPSLLSYYS